MSVQELVDLVTTPRPPKRPYHFNGKELLRHTAASAPVYKMRESSTGEEATLANSEHHALVVKPFIQGMLAVTELCKLKKWIQGNNVHVIISAGGTEYRWRPMWIKTDTGGRYYHGLKCLRVEKDNNQTCILKITSLDELLVVMKRWVELLETT